MLSAFVLYFDLPFQKGTISMKKWKISIALIASLPGLILSPFAYTSGVPTSKSFSGSDKPIIKTCKSRVGMIASLTGGSTPQLVVKSKKGTPIGHLSGLPSIVDVKWDANGRDLLIITDPPSGKKTGILYIYSTRHRRLRRITYGVSGNWIVSRRYVLIKLRNDLVDNGVIAPGIEGWNKLLVLDPMRHFAEALKIGPLTAYERFSPGGGKIAYIARERDDRHGFEKYAVKVADISSGKERVLATGGRIPVFLWRGESHLAVTVYSPSMVSTLCLIGLNGNVTKLLTTNRYYDLTPVDSPRVPGSVVYKTRTPEEAMFHKGDLWSVRPGCKPVLLNHPKNQQKWHGMEKIDTKP
jgi:hypothetical protein